MKRKKKKLNFKKEFNSIFYQLMTVGEEKNRENISFEVSKRERKINIQHYSESCYLICVGKMGKINAMHNLWYRYRYPKI